MIQRSEMFQFPARARHEHQAEQSERDGIPGEATKVISKDNFLTFFKVQFSFLGSRIFFYFSHPYISLIFGGTVKNVVAFLLV